MELAKRNSIQWTSAHEACAEAMRHALQLNVNVSVAVVDCGGELLAFLRNPSAPFHCSDIARDKAYTAAGFKLPTHRWAEVSQKMSPAVKEGLLQRERMVMFGGGYPVLVDGETVGGIGVSGASEEQDMACALAALRKIGAEIESP